MKIQNKFILLIIVLSVLLSACGTFEVNFEQPSNSIVEEPTKVVDSTSEPQATETPPPPHPMWTEIRDESLGFGFALPCWWIIYAPINVSSFNRTYTVASYDEAYFMQNSVKGWWIGGDYPDGAVKLDISGIELASLGIEATTSTSEVIKRFLTSDMQVVQSITEKSIGSKQAFLVLTNRPDNPAESFPNYVFRISPESILMVNVYPARAIPSQDIQGIMASIALLPEQEVNRPVFAPAEPLIEVPPACTNQ